jgi:hypothetical protein
MGQKITKSPDIHKKILLIIQTQQPEVIVIKLPRKREEN